jgi:hypothetical protein
MGPCGPHYIQRPSHEDGIVTTSISQGHVTGALHRICRGHIRASHLFGHSCNLSTLARPWRRSSATDDHIELINFQCRQSVRNVSATQCTNDQDAPSMWIKIVKENTGAYIGTCGVMRTIQDN